jgi:hypothetical protein
MKYLSFLLVVFIGCINKSDKNVKPGITELDTISFDNLSEKAYEYLDVQQQITEDSFKIGSYENWYYDQNTGELSFSDSNVKKVIIDYEEVGSFSSVSNTWLWSWANLDLEYKIRSQIGQVKKYGKSRGFDKLTNYKWKADQYDGWEMTAIAAYLMKAKGAYRIPSRDSSLFSFLIYKNIRWADSSDRD